MLSLAPAITNYPVRLDQFHLVKYMLRLGLSRDFCVTLPRDAMGMSSVNDCVIS